MKITELKCPACGAVFKVKDEKANIAECEYCGGKFTLEWEHPNTPEQTANVRPLTETTQINYTPIRFEDEDQTPVPLWKRLCTGAALLCFLGACLTFLILRRDTDSDNKPAPITRNPLAGITGSASSDKNAKKTAPYGLLADALGMIFGKSAEAVSADEIAKIQWLVIGSDLNFRKVGYSFDNPIENPDAALTWLTFPRDAYKDNALDCLPSFTGLKMVYPGQTLQKSQLAGLSLQGFRGSYKSLEQVAGLVDPASLRMLEIDCSVDLNGLALFPNLETLIINGKEIENQKLLANSSIKSLSLNLSSGTMDFSVLGMMPSLEELTISCKAMKDINFVTKLSSLKKLSLERCAILTLAPLEHNAVLTGLSVTNCSDMKDLSAISTMTGLTTLTLGLPYQCPEPDLSGLTNMTALSLSGFDDTSFLKYMTKLESLELQNCTPGGADDFASLTHLKYLRLGTSGFQTQDYSFLTGLTALERLDLHGMSIYTDISGVFNLKTLKELNLNNASCEINFDKITENTTLEVLSIDKIKLFENIYIRQSGGMTDIYYDDVSLTEHLEFLGKLKGLQTLSICKNELTSVSFAGSLPALQSIDFSDNYVTDLSPLSSLKNLRQVTCTENPVANYDVLGDTVTISR